MAKRYRMLYTSIRVVSVEVNLSQVSLYVVKRHFQ